MGIVYDPVVVLNLAFDVAILGLGAYAYVAGRLSAGMWIGLGFGFFGVSYGVTMLGYGGSTAVLLLLRVLGYAAVIVGLVRSLLTLEHRLGRPAPSRP